MFKEKKNSTQLNTITIGDVVFKLPYSHLLPGLDEERFRQLEDSIAAKREVAVSVIVDENYNVIDGEHRLRAASAIGMKQIPFVIRPGLSEDDKLQLVFDLNISRRQLNKKQIQEAMLKLRTMGRSLRQISENLGVSAETVRRNINAASASNETVELPDAIVGRDNKKRKSKVMPRKQPTVAVYSTHDLGKAVKACNDAGVENLPGKTIDLRRVTRLANEKQIKDRRNQQYKDFHQSNVELWLGDFNERGKVIEDNSIDLVFTDPPYDYPSLSLFEAVAGLCKRVLKPGGIFATYCGSLYLPEIHDLLRKHLSYLWTGAVIHGGSKKLVPAVKVHQGFKVVAIYHKPPKKLYWKPFLDVVSGGQAKVHHKWEQPVQEAFHYISALCPRDGVLLDPMMGSGTSVVAGLQHGVKKCIGIDVDPAAYAVAEARIREHLTNQQENVA